ncbi:metalloprotease family protein [Paenibacillus sp. MMS20-IR301]|uniref:metalloprotease family protein n=1 Tax=Paenibacillus sp. MMS20-IR301 TaxID=2895946 RepID=UPI0028EE7516|nr:metalloprotease family protein [Paenibacillus sp. MMS20-IR301]WNS45604.1 metalloprotease family protein [Paenibacillus sp. MMS20-IR301]
MFFIPGFIISIITFPGVIVHEFAHQLFCRLFRTSVLDVCYFRVGNPSGYVVHEHPRKNSHQIWIGLGPFFINSLIGALIALPAAIPVMRFGSPTIVDYILIWLGVSIAMHSIPSTGDAKNIWNSVKDKQTSWLVKIVMTPIVGLIYLFSFGSVLWLDLIYGFAVATGIPYLLINLLA